MKKLIIFLIILLTQTSGIYAENLDEIERIVVGEKNAKITIIAYESLTCSHCADFHINVYPKLKREYLDTGIAKIEFRHFPLDAAAFNASKVSQCKNDGSSEILNLLFLNQQKWIKGKSNKKYNDKLVDYVRQYYEVSSVEAKDYIDILGRDEKGIESLTNIVKTYGVDEKELKRVMK